jgi:DNA-binding transcriptional MerR regulator
MLTIAEAAQQSGLSAHTLRYYERAGLLEANRAANGHRHYTDADLQRVGFVQKLRATGMPIREVRRYFAAEPEQRIEILRTHRRHVVALMDELTASLNLIDYKIDLYEQGALLCASAD